MSYTITDTPHCPENNTKVCIKTEPVTAGAEAFVHNYTVHIYRIYSESMDTVFIYCILQPMVWYGNYLLPYIGNRIQAYDNLSTMELESCIICV